MPINASLLLRARFFLLLMIVVLGLPAIVAGTLAIYEQNRKQTLLALKERAPLVIQLVENDISAKLQALIHASILLDVSRIDDVTQHQLEGVVSGFSGVVWAGVASVDGTVLLAHNNLLKGVNVSTRPWFKQGLMGPSVLDRHDAVLLAKLLPDREDPYRFIDLAVPIHSPTGEVLGVLALHVDWIWYQKRFPALLGHTSNDASIAYVVAGQDHQIRLLNASVSDTRLISEALSEGAFPGSLRDKFYVAEATGPKGGELQTLGWSLYVIQNKEFARQRVMSAAVFGLIAFLTGLFAATFLFVRMTRQISRTSAAFIDALSVQDMVNLEKLRPLLPQEILPLSTRAERLIQELRERRASLECALDDARGSYMEVSRLIDQAPLAIAMFDRNMCYVAHSELWRTTYFPQESNPVGKSHYDLFPGLPDAWKIAHQQGMCGQIVKKEDDTWVDASGEQTWIDWTVQPWSNHDGSVGGIIIITEDVTQANQSKIALARSEERFQLAMKGSHDGLWDWDIASNEVYFSPAWMNMLGYQPNEFPASVEVWEKLLHPDDAVQARRALFEIMEDVNQAQYTQTFRLAHKQGHWVKILSRGLILRNEDGTPNRMVGTHLDRTEVESLQNKLNEAWILAQAEARSNEAKSSFLASVSHEIRNPLNSVCGFARLIRDDVREPETKRYAQLLIQTTDSLTLVLNDLLDFAKIDAGKLEIHQEPFNLASVMDELSESALLLCREKQITFEYAKRWVNGTCYIGDVGRIRQIVQNLLSNAIKFTDAGQISLKVFTELDGEGNNKVSIAVTDTGIGMPSDKLDKLFKPFSQLHSDSGNRYGGTGLGLTIVKSLVDLMQGVLVCESSTGQGSQFSVSFSLPVTNCIEGETIGYSLPGRPRKILIADDSPINLKVLSAFLGKRGHEVVSASNGESALRHLQEFAFDYALLDMDMPGLSGLEVVTAVKDSEGLNAQAHFACLSGHAARSMTELALGGGFERYFTKPLNLDDVLRYVHGEV